MTTLVLDPASVGQNIHHMMDARQITVRDLQGYLGLDSVQSVYQWLNGRNLPSIDNLYRMSRLFQVSVDSLLSSEDVSECSSPNTSS